MGLFEDIGRGADDLIRNAQGTIGQLGHQMSAGWRVLAGTLNEDRQALSGFPSILGATLQEDYDVLVMPTVNVLNSGAALVWQTFFRTVDNIVDGVEFIRDFRLRRPTVPRLGRPDPAGDFVDTFNNIAPAFATDLSGNLIKTFSSIQEGRAFRTVQPTLFYSASRRNPSTMSAWKFLRAVRFGTLLTL